MSQEAPVIVEGRGHAAKVQCVSEGMEEWSKVVEVPLTLSRQSTAASLSNHSTYDTFVDTMDMEECLRKIQYLEIEAQKNRKREQDIMQQIHEAQARILEKDKEVCNLQAQILEELRERQEMAREVLEKDFKILCLQESCAGSQARALDADTCSVFKTAAESSCSLKVGSSNVASGVRLTPASNSHVNQFANACGSILPTLPKQDMMFSPQQSPQRGVRQLQVTPPSSPNLSIWASLPQQFKSHEKEVPSWGQPCGNAMSRRVVMQNLQVRNTSRPMTYR
jgi:hypothetical protein